VLTSIERGARQLWQDVPLVPPIKESGEGTF
jgi:hypothetical protein